MKKQAKEILMGLAAVISAVLTLATVGRVYTIIVGIQIPDRAGMVENVGTLTATGSTVIVVAVIVVAALGAFGQSILRKIEKEQP